MCTLLFQRSVLNIRSTVHPHVLVDMCSHILMNQNSEDRSISPEDKDGISYLLPTWSIPNYDFYP